MTKRPTPAARNAKAKGDDTTVVLHVDGVKYSFRFQSINGRDSLTFRHAFHMGPREALAVSKNAPEIDIVAGLVWLARRQNGENIDIETVLESLSYDTDFSSSDDPDDPDVIDADTVEVDNPLQ